MADFFTTLSAIGSAQQIAENSTRYRKILNNFWNHVLTRKLAIAIFGCGGTGKTTLGKFLSGEPIEDYNYFESYEIEKYDHDEVFKKIKVVPGQEERVDRYWGKLYKKINEGKVNLILNLASYGYHSIGGLDNIKETEYYKSGMSELEFLDTYLYSRRQKELDFLKRILPRIEDSKNEIKMLTIVNKQDLWWDNREEVKKFYTEGEYNRLIEKSVRRKGAENFSHDYLSLSLADLNFRVGNDLLKNTVSGYDDILRKAHKNQLLITIEKLLNNG